MTQHSSSSSDMVTDEPHITHQPAVGHPHQTHRPRVDDVKVHPQLPPPAKAGSDHSIVVYPGSPQCSRFNQQVSTGCSRRATVRPAVLLYVRGEASSASITCSYEGRSHSHTHSFQKRVSRNETVRATSTYSSIRAASSAHRSKLARPGSV